MMTFLKTVPDAINIESFNLFVFIEELLLSKRMKAIEYTMHLTEEKTNLMNSNEFFVLLKL